MYRVPPNEHLVENRSCKHCGEIFPITDKDIEFYVKVSVIFGWKKYLIPPPTLCPECRQQRRQTFKNIYHLYKDEKTWIISPISPDKWYNVVSQEAWWSDANLGLNFGREFDFSRWFFDQFANLQKVAPRWNLIQIRSENCDWCVNMSDSRNCYSVKSGWWDENCYYGERVFNSKDAVDGVRIDDTSNCYDSYNIRDCYAIF